ncbi:MAG: PH domain-containing protein [Chitinophagaceae bacterium]|nr:PH domain-containing protein [Chitinophagaceae bacterium]
MKLPPDPHDFSVPQRQSVAAIFILVVKSAVLIAKNMWPLLVITFLRSNKWGFFNKWLFVIITFAVISILFAVIRYLFYRYYIKDNNLIIQTGWLRKKTLSIPIKSIQAVHVEQNIWQQLFRVSKVTLDGAGSEKTEIQIDAIDMLKAEQLKQVLLLHADTKFLGGTTIEADEIYKLSIADLFKLSLSANHLEAFVILFAVSLNVLDDIRKAFNFDGWGYMERYAGRLQGHVVLASTVVIIFMAVISIAFSTIRIFIKYFDFSLHNSNQKWKISFGLFNRTQKIIPHNKIQLYGWHANWLRRKLNFWLLDVKTVGQQEIKEKKHFKIPLTSMVAATSLVNAYQQTPVFNIEAAETIEPDYWRRKTLTTGLTITILLGLILVYWLQWQALWVAFVMLYFAFTNYRWFKNFRWQYNQEGLQLYSGLWGRRYQLLVWKKIQQVNVHQSPYQRRHKLATLKFTTAGGSVILPYIKLATAQRLVNSVLYWVESRNETWM